MKFYIIGDKDTVTGFSLAGVRGAAVNSKTEALKALKGALDSKDTGIILITHQVARGIQETIDEILSRKRCRVILQIPGTGGASDANRSVEDFVLTALGIRV